MTLNDVINSICKQIKTWLPDLKTCESHGGRFDLKEIQRISGQAPAVYVSILATGKPKEVGTGEQDIPVTFAAYVVATDRNKLPRAVAALNMTECLIVKVCGQNWGYPDQVFGAGTASSKNLYSGMIAKKGVALWAVTWQQTVRVGDDIFKTDLPMPSKLYTGLSPDIGEDNDDDYQVIENEETP